MTPTQHLVMKPIPSNPGYLVDRSGNVYSTIRRCYRPGHVGVLYKNDGPPVLLAARPQKTGYLRVAIGSGKSRKHKLVHRLVLEAFVGPCPLGMEAAHANGIRTDNRLENLSWKTPKDNSNDKWLVGTMAFGDSHPGAKLTAESVSELLALREQGASWGQLADRFGVSKRAIGRVIHGKTWCHVTTPTHWRPLPEAPR